MVLTVTIHDPFSNAWKSDPIFGIAVDTIVLSHYDDGKYVNLAMMGILTDRMLQMRKYRIEPYVSTAARNKERLRLCQTLIG